MTFEEYIAWLEAAIEKMEYGAAAMADAMAEYLADRVANDTLRRTHHAPGAYHKAAPGAPPAYASGNLARSMFTTPSSASRGPRATALVGNNARYAKLMEHGGCVLPADLRQGHALDGHGRLLVSRPAPRSRGVPGAPVP